MTEKKPIVCCIMVAPIFVYKIWATRFVKIRVPSTLELVPPLNGLFTIKIMAMEAIIAQHLPWGACAVGSHSTTLIFAPELNVFCLAINKMTCARKSFEWWQALERMPLKPLRSRTSSKWTCFLSQVVIIDESIGKGFPKIQHSCLFSPIYPVSYTHLTLPTILLV